MKSNKNCKKLVNPLCLDLLISLSTKDITNCSYLLSCKYFNTDKYVSKLYSVLVKQIVNLQREYTAELKTLIYNQVFGISLSNELKKEEDNKLRAKYSDLIKVILQCLSIEALSKHKNFEDDLIFKELLLRKQYKLLQRRANSSRKSLLNTEHRSSDFHKNFFVIEENVQMMNRFMGKPFQKEKLEDINKHLDISYIIDKLKIQITLLTEQSSSINLYDYSSMEAIKDLLNLYPYKNHTSIKLYSYASTLAKEPTENKYYEFLNLLSKHPNQLPKEETESLYDIATNFCTRQIRLNNFDYKHLFDLYKLMHNNNFLIRDDYIDENKLKNIVTACCRTNEFKWAKELIETCFSYLTKSTRVSVQNFNLGAVAFYQKKYDKAHNFFSKVQDINTIYNNNNRLMLAKTYYETDKYYDWPTFTHFNSELRYFDRNKQLPKRTSKAYKVFFLILKDLYRIKHGVTKKDLEQVVLKLKRQENVVTRNWLLEKIEELSKSKKSPTLKKESKT